MTKKKVILSICALVLVCVISVSGTLAYLTARSDSVTNTFTAAGTKLAEEFTLDESRANPGKTPGAYELNEEERVQRNEYAVLPGTTVKKDPTIHITGRTDVPAYLYVEVLDRTKQGIEYSLFKHWEVLDGVMGLNGGTVYAYIGEPTDGDVYILNNNQVSVASNFESQGEIELTFYAYMAQASLGAAPYADKAEVFKAAFLNN